MDATLAVVWLPNGVSKAIRTAPGQWLKFVGGRAEVKHEMHMPHVLAMPEARVQVSHGWREWLPKWVDLVPGYDDKVKATVDVLAADGSVLTETAAAWEPVDRVSFGRHKAACECQLCHKARARAVASSLDALPV